jgi:WD40 repeat protein
MRTYAFKEITMMEWIYMRSGRTGEGARQVPFGRAAYTVVILIVTTLGISACSRGGQIITELNATVTQGATEILPRSSTPPVTELEDVLVTRQGPTNTPWPQPTGTLGPSTLLAPTKILEATEISDEPPVEYIPPLPRLNVGTTPMLYELHMINQEVGWAISADQTRSDLRKSFHLLRTEDGGSSWTEVTAPQRVREDRVPTLVLSGYFLDAERAWVILHGDLRETYIWHTEDGGRRWLATAFAHRNPLSDGWPLMYFTNRNDGWLLFSYFIGMHNYDEDILRTHDGGKTWETILLEEYQLGPIRDFGAANTKVAWITSGLGAGFNPPYRLHLTNDGGKSWQHVIPHPESNPSPLPGDCVLHEPNVQNYFQGRVLRSCSLREPPYTRYYLGFTVNAGNNWSYVEAPGVPYWLDEIHGWAMSQGEPWLANEADDVPIYQTSDGGRSWREISRVDWVGSLDFVDQKHGWALSDGNLFRTDDGGRSWSAMRMVLGAPEERPSDYGFWAEIPARLAELQKDNVSSIYRLDRFYADSPTSLAINDRKLYVGSQDGHVAVWDWLTGSRRLRPEMPRYWLSDSWIYDLDTPADRGGFYAALRDGRVMYYEDSNYSELESIYGGHGEQSAVVSLGDEFVAAGEDGRIRIWHRSRIVSGTWFSRRLHGSPRVWVWGIDVSTDGWLIAAGSSDRKARIWDSASGELLMILEGHSSAVTKVRFSPDGQRLATASRDGTVRVWDSQSGRQIMLLRGHDDWVLDIAYSPDGSLLASVDGDGWMQIWDAYTGKMLKRQLVCVGPSRAIVFRPDSRMLITACDEGYLNLWGIVE